MSAQQNYVLKLGKGVAPYISSDGWNAQISWSFKEGLVEIIDDTTVEYDYFPIVDIFCLLQVSYPEDSYSHSHIPRGGMGLYAGHLDLVNSILKEHIIFCLAANVIRTSNTR